MGSIYFNGSELTGQHDVNFNGVSMDTRTNDKIVVLVMAEPLLLGWIVPFYTHFYNFLRGRIFTELLTDCSWQSSHRKITPLLVEAG